MKPYIKFYEFNLRRYQRRADAVRFEIDEGFGTQLVWMSRKDIERNIKNFGPNKELERGLEAYRTAGRSEEATPQMKNTKPYKILAHYNTGTMLLSRHETEQQALDAYEKALDENQGARITIESPENPFEEPIDQE